MVLAPMVTSLLLFAALASSQTDAGARAVLPPLPPEHTSREELAIPPGPRAALGVLGRLDAPLIDTRRPRAPLDHWSHWWITERPSALAELLGQRAQLLDDEVVRGEVFSVLKRGLRGPASDVARGAAARALGRIAPRLDEDGQEEVVVLLDDVFADENAPIVLRASAAMGLGLDASDDAVAALLVPFEGRGPSLPLALQPRVLLALGAVASARQGEPELQQKIAVLLMEQSKEEAIPEVHAAALAALGLVALPQADHVPGGDLRKSPLASAVSSRAALVEWLRGRLESGPDGLFGAPLVRAYAVVTLARAAAQAPAGDAARLSASGALAAVVVDRKESEHVRAAALGALLLLDEYGPAETALSKTYRTRSVVLRGPAAACMARLEPARASFNGPARTWAALARATRGGTGGVRGAIDPDLWTSGAGIALGLGLSGAGGQWWSRSKATKRALDELDGELAPAASAHAALACGLLDGASQRQALELAFEASWRDPELMLGIGQALIITGADGTSTRLMYALRETENPLVEAAAGELLGHGPGAERIDELLELAKERKEGALTALGHLAATRDEAWHRVLWRGHPYGTALASLRGGDRAGPGVLDTGF